MTWVGQNPPANDVLASFTIDLPKHMAVYIEVDKLPQHAGRPATYRASLGNLFQYEHLGTAHDLEELLRRCRAVQQCEGVRAAQQAMHILRAWLGDGDASASR